MKAILSAPGLHQPKRHVRPKPGCATVTERNTLFWIRGYVASTGNPPTVRETAEAFGLSPGSAQQRLRQLAEKGFIARKPYMHRGIVLLVFDFQWAPKTDE